jgi:hypothetical protein
MHYVHHLEPKCFHLHAAETFPIILPDLTTNLFSVSYRYQATISYFSTD